MRNILILIALVICSCKTKQQTADPDLTFVPDFTMGPPAIVYKTNKKNFDKVPVLLSDDKSRVVGYPGKSDLRGNGEFPLPFKLQNGYLLDNRGINANTAFLNLTYTEYEKLQPLPSTAEMYSLISDKDPFTEMCDCGSKKAFSDIEKQLNMLIEFRKLKEVCRVIK